MNKIEFYKNPDGTQPVKTFLSFLQKKGAKDAGWKQFYMLVLRGMIFLQDYGVNHAKSQTALLQREDGDPYSILLVKDLIGYVPLLEFRINWKGTGAARILFIEYSHEGYSYFVLMRAIVKQKTTDPAFEALRDEAFQLIPDFLKDPQKYINLPGE
jgi:hypothetical protein